jgi:hypothetical protein
MLDCGGLWRNWGKFQGWALPRTSTKLRFFFLFITANYLGQRKDGSGNGREEFEPTEPGCFRDARTSLLREAAPIIAAAVHQNIPLLISKIELRFMAEAFGLSNHFFSRRLSLNASHVRLSMGAMTGILASSMCASPQVIQTTAIAPCSWRSNTNQLA